MQLSILVVFVLISGSKGKLIKSSPSEYLSNYFDQLRLLVAEMLYIAQVNRCYAIITDDTHYVLFEKFVFEKPRHLHVNFFLRIPDSEDLLVPSYQTVRVLKEIQAHNCDLHLILLSNGQQVSRFMIFLEDYRVLNTRAKFVFLHNHRVLAKDMIYIWRNFVQSIFLRWRLTDEDKSKGQFSILTVPYPNILKGVVLTKELSTWKDGKFRNKVNIFQDKMKDFMGEALRTVVFEHTPMVIKTKDGGYRGLEVEIIRSLEKALNFKAFFYETKDAETERWGRILPNRSFTGLINEMVSRKAKLAIGDLHLNSLYSNVMDLSVPHTHECLTFLTPESSRDNSWKTLILPFSANTWACVLSAQLIVGTVFYIVSFSHSVSIVGQASRKQDFFSFFKKRKTLVDPKMFRDVKFRSSLNRRTARRGTIDLFDDFSNCILLTFSMSLYVALPRMPKNWPLRILTGWYWMYCITLVVFYRASFTAILANPAPRITIDTLEELAKSSITASVWGAENQKFFNEAFDEVAQDIGEQLELIDDIYGVTDRIAKGYFAYYDNVFFLRYLRHLGSQRRQDAEILHIMNECVVNMPISIGMEKNSPLKPIVDKYLAWMKESGLMTKWLKDATEDLSSEEMSPQEALMNLKKFWSSFVALSLGYLLSTLTIISEAIYFKYIVAKHPLYDKYNPRIYYNYQRRFNQ